MSGIPEHGRAPGQPGHAPRRRATGALLAAALALFAAWPSSGARAAADDLVSLEHRVKAAYLYNFTRYVEWPPSTFPSAQSPIRVGVVGSDAVAAELERIAAGRTVQSRSIAVQRMSGSEPMAGVHIVFIADGASANTPQIAQAALPHSVLVVTESSQALARGSIINFLVEDRRVRFEIALDSADKSNLRLSSRLLAVAHHVRTGVP